MKKKEVENGPFLRMELMLLTRSFVKNKLFKRRTQS